MTHRYLHPTLRNLLALLIALPIALPMRLLLICADLVDHHANKEQQP